MSRTFHRIHIFGASGSGTSTLGKALSIRKHSKFVDTDDYFWKTKYSEINEIDDRIALLRNEINNVDDWVLSGSLCGWGDRFIPDFDLVIFVYLPREVRMARLEQREKERYGNDILPGGSRYSEYKALMEWAGNYDSGGMDLRSKLRHEQWLHSVNCPVFRLEGEISVIQKLARLEEWEKV